MNQNRSFFCNLHFWNGSSKQGNLNAEQKKVENCWIRGYEGTPQFKLIGNQIWAYFTLGEAYFGNAYSYFQIRRIWVRRIWRTLKKAYLCVITTKYKKHLTTCDRVVPCTAIVEILLIPCKYSKICRIQLHSKNQGNTNTYSYFWIRLNTFLYDVIV